MITIDKYVSIWIHSLRGKEKGSLPGALSVRIRALEAALQRRS